MRSKFLFFFVLLSLSVSLSGLELQRGKIKLVLNDKSGRLSLYGTEDPAKPVWTPLFLADDPTTTKWKLQLGEKHHVLGDDSAFSTSVESTAAGAKVVWTSKTLVATLTYDFLISAAGTQADGLRLGLSVVNVSEASARVGVRFVLDTNLGEKKDHFRTSAGDVHNAEYRIEGNLPDWWLSTASADDPLGLVVMTGKGATPPARLYFANWRRLDDTLWEPAYKAGRDFNLLPYSFNDSAAAQIYEAQELPSGSTREIVVLMGLKSARTFEGARIGSANPLDDLLKKNQNPALSAIDQDLASLQTLLAQIDAKIADPARVTAEDLKLLRAVLDQIEAKRKSLEAAKP